MHFKELSMQKKLVFCFLFIFLLISVSPRGMIEKSKKTRWEKDARLGKYYSSYENWRDIEIFARQEGEVVVYSNTPRIYDFIMPFYKKYSIKPYPFELSNEEIFKKMKKEQDLGLYNVDLVLTSDSAECNNWLSLGRVYSYTPRSVAKVLDEHAAGEDLAVQRYTAEVVLYNNENNPNGSPIDTWWDLTREKYKGKVAFKDPFSSATLMYLFSMMVYNAEDMELAYKEEFGEEYLNSKRDENAGFEFIKRLFENSPIITLDDETSAKLTGKRNSPDAPISIVSSSIMGMRNDSNLAFDVDWRLKPFGGVLVKNVMVIPFRAPNPNASKLLVKWLFGFTEKSGYENYKVAGEWSVLKNVDKMPGQPFLKNLNFWVIDDEWLYENIHMVQDFAKGNVEKYYYEE